MIQLNEKINALGLDIPLSEHVEILREPLRLGAFKLRNRLAIQPMEGCDGTAAGRPGELTRRRYLRFAQSGAGLLWFEAVAIVPEGRANPRQLLVNQEHLDSLKYLVNEIKEISLKECGFVPAIIMQATHSGRYSKPEGIAAYENPERPPCKIITDDEIKLLEEAYGEATRLAILAGFDGIDVKACHGYLCSELLSAFTRPGEYGGSFENRAKLLINGVKAAQANAKPGFTVTSRLNIYDGYTPPNSFGLEENMDEPLRLIDVLHNNLGMDLLNVTMGNPYQNPHVNRPFDHGPYQPPEHPLVGVERMYRLTGQMQQAFPGLAIMASGPSYLRQYGINLVAGAIEQNFCKIVGFGRQAFAYPQFARDALQSGRLEPGQCCIACGKCSQLMRAGSTAGCVVRDSLYREIYERDVKQ